MYDFALKVIVWAEGKLSKFFRRLKNTLVDQMQRRAWWDQYYVHDYMVITKLRRQLRQRNQQIRDLKVAVSANVMSDLMRVLDKTKLSPKDQQRLLTEIRPAVAEIVDHEPEVQPGFQITLNTPRDPYTGTLISKSVEVQPIAIPIDSSPPVNVGQPAVYHPIAVPYIPPVEVSTVKPEAPKKVSTIVIDAALQARFAAMHQELEAMKLLAKKKP